MTDDGKEKYNFLMIQYIGRDGREAWMCKECYMDMENKTERKINQECRQTLPSDQKRPLM